MDLAEQLANLWGEYSEYVMSLPANRDVSSDSFGNFMEWLFNRYAEPLVDIERRPDLDHASTQVGPFESYSRRTNRSV